MRPYVELFIEDKQVEFTSPPEIHMTYTHEDLHNPTVVKNSYSKTLTIDGTPKNNQIFGTYFNMQREVAYGDDKSVGAYFNPAKKVPFTLYRNGEKMEHGYCKLDNVKRNGNTIQYNVTLYGGLGQFLYALSYKEDGEQMKLSDLNYGGGEAEFDMEVNKETVRDAWNHINGTPVGSIYDKINFAPCYNGIPKDFTADKVAIYVDGFKFSDDLQVYNQFITSKDGYTTVDGWLIGELAKEYDEWQMKDLRSYLQRPVIRFKEIINACCDTRYNGGYTVDLDADFFNKDNPYYEEAWMTLPLITEIDVNDDEIGTVDFDQNGDVINISGDIEEGDVITFKCSVGIGCNAASSVSSLSTFHYSQTWDGSDESAPQDDSTNVARYLQIVAYDKDGKAIGGSPVYSFYSGYGQFTYTPEYATTTQVITGDYIRVADGEYLFGNTHYDMEVPNIEYKEGMYFKVIEKFAYYSEGYSSADKTKLWYYDEDTEQYRYATVSSFFNEVATHSQNIAITKKKMAITKKTLLNSEKTPCDYFLSYLKMFNLHIWQNEDDVIVVRMRKNYFTGDEYDLEDLIDRGSDIEITPLTFDAKYYNFDTAYETDEKLYKDYKDEYGLSYGIMKVDTNYNFDSSSKNLFEGNVFNGCITSRGKSKYYMDIYQSVGGDDAFYPPFMLDGCNTLLFKDSDTTEGAYITPKTAIEGNNWWTERYHDFMPKPNFTDSKNEPVDGANVLLFYNGKADTLDEKGTSMRIQISDDIPQFDVLNEGEPCWIWSYDWRNVIMDIDYLPVFGRYKTNENGWVTHSWDFGTPKALYIPDYKIDDSSNLYTQFWQPYIRDRYNINTRVAECNVLLKERVVGDWLRRFYFWDGCWWIMNKITDYNPTSNNTTKCEMVKINDPQNYK